MQGNRLVLPFGTLPPMRGDSRDDSTHFAAACPNTSPLDTLPLLDPNLSTSSMAMVKHDEEIARVTNQAYLDAISSSPTLRPSPARPSPNHSSSNMFIKVKPKKSSTSKTDLQATLDRNRNLLKSREVCRLLNTGQLDKLKSDTMKLEKTLQAKKEEESEQSLEHVMKGLKVYDGDNKATSNRLISPTTRYAIRGKAKMISAQENVKLQRANFEAEQQMQQTKEYEMMGRQMGKMDLISSKSSRNSKRNTTDEREDDVNLLGLGQDIDESDMGLQDSDDW